MRRRDGMVLLEVIVALTILAAAGSALIALVVESTAAMTRAEAAEQEMARASAFMDAVALWPRADLDRHLGDRPEGRWRLSVERERPDLYTVTIADSSNGRALVATSLFRPEADSGTR